MTRTSLLLLVLLCSSSCMFATSVGWLYATSVAIELTVEEQVLETADELGPIGAGLVFDEDGFSPLFLVCSGSAGRVAFRFDEWAWAPADEGLRARYETTYGTNIVDRECPEISVHAEARRIIAEDFVCEGEVEGVPPEWFGEATTKTEPQTLDESEADCHVNFFGVKEEATPTPVEVNLSE